MKNSKISIDDIRIDIEGLAAISWYASNNFPPRVFKKLSYMPFHYERFIESTTVRALRPAGKFVYLELLCKALGSDVPGSLLGDELLSVLKSYKDDITEDDMDIIVRAFKKIGGRYWNSNVIKTWLCAKSSVMSGYTGGNPKLKESPEVSRGRETAARIISYLSGAEIPVEMIEDLNNARRKRSIVEVETVGFRDVLNESIDQRSPETPSEGLKSPEVSPGQGDGLKGLTEDPRSSEVVEKADNSDQVDEIAVESEIEPASDTKIRRSECKDLVQGNFDDFWDKVKGIHNKHNLSHLATKYATARKYYVAAVESSKWPGDMECIRAIESVAKVQADSRDSRRRANRADGDKTYEPSLSKWIESESWNDAVIEVEDIVGGFVIGEHY